MHIQEFGQESEKSGMPNELIPCTTMQCRHHRFYNEELFEGVDKFYAVITSEIQSLIIYMYIHLPNDTVCNNKLCMVYIHAMLHQCNDSNKPLESHCICIHNPPFVISACRNSL